MPLIAQITGAVALVALIMGPWWASAPDTIPQSPTVPQSRVAPLAPAVPQVSAVPPAPATPVNRERPAHLNLDVRHAFASVDLRITVDGKPALQTTLEGSGKRFKVFGKRAERNFTRTLNLSPGVHIVGVRVSSPADRFDQTRVERFDLGSSSVAGLNVSADRSGLSLVANHPPPPARAPAPPPPAETAPVAAPVQVAQTAALPAQTAVRQQEANTTIDLLQSVRSMLIAIAGFVASAATGFVVQEWLRSRRGMIFHENAVQQAQPAGRGERRRRRRPGQPRTGSDSQVPATDHEPSI